MLSQGQKPIVMANYPHMGNIDALVWSAYLEKEGSDIERVWYDVYVGLGIPLPANASEQDRRRMEACYCKRIDAVTVRSGLYEVWEVKPYANSVSLGQALVYIRHFKKRYPSCSPARANVVCASVDEDCSPEMEDQGIKCVCVGNVLGGLPNIALLPPEVP